MPNLPIPTQTLNPLSTVTQNRFFSQDGEGAYNLGSVAASGTLTFTVDQFPALYYYSGQGATAAKNTHGFIAVPRSGSVFITSHQLLATSGTTADSIVVTISGGTVTLTSQATSETKTNNFLSKIV